MTKEQAKKEFEIMAKVVGKILTLNEHDRVEVINTLIMIFCEFDGCAHDRVEALIYCLNQFNKVGAAESRAITKYLVDRIIPNRFDMPCDATPKNEEKEVEKVIEVEDQIKDEATV